MLVYDITNKESFESLGYWLSEVANFAPEDIKVMVVGNKCDLVEERVVTKEEATEWAAKVSAERPEEVAAVETSSLSGAGVDDSFLALAKLCVEGACPPKRPSGIDLNGGAGGKIFGHVFMVVLVLLCSWSCWCCGEKTTTTL